MCYKVSTMLSGMGNLDRMDARQAADFKEVHREVVMEVEEAVDMVALLADFLPVESTQYHLMPKDINNIGPERMDMADRKENPMVMLDLEMGQPLLLSIK